MSASSPTTLPCLQVPSTGPGFGPCYQRSSGSMRTTVVSAWRAPGARTESLLLVTGEQGRLVERRRFHLLGPEETEEPCRVDRQPPPPGPVAGHRPDPESAAVEHGEILVRQGMDDVLLYRKPGGEVRVGYVQVLPTASGGIHGEEGAGWVPAAGHVLAGMESGLGPSSGEAAEGRTVEGGQAAEEQAFVRADFLKSIDCGRCGPALSVLAEPGARREWIRLCFAIW